MLGGFGLAPLSINKLSERRKIKIFSILLKFVWHNPQFMLQ